MRTKTLGVTSVTGSLLLAGAGNADFTGVSFVTHDVGPTSTTYRFYANFDDPADQILAVSGTTKQPLTFQTDTVLVNDGGLFDGLKQEDFAAFPISSADDSWVTIGDDEFVGNHTDYSPSFLNNDGVNRVIEGTSWSDTNDGWFDASLESPITGTSILIAQFTVAHYPGCQHGLVSFSGNVDWRDGGVGAPGNTPFAVIVGSKFPAAPCCLPDRSCVALKVMDCLALSGVWHPEQCSCVDLECGCPPDLDDDGEVGFADLLALLVAWGPCRDCPEDLDGSGDVGLPDLLALLAGWGPCRG